MYLIDYYNKDNHVLNKRSNIILIINVVHEKKQNQKKDG